MIDNYAEAMKLVEKMKTHLPIIAQPTKAFVQAMRQKGIKLKSKHVLQIDDVLYMGDEGGIGCAISLMGEEKAITIASLTHLRIKARHPLAQEIRAYQVERTQKLAGNQTRRPPASPPASPRNKGKKS